MCPEGSLMVKALQSFIDFAAAYYSQVSSICLTILSTYATVWMAWQFYKLAASVPSDLKQVIDDLTAIIATEVLLIFPSMVWEVYRALLGTGIWAAGKAYSGDGGSPGNAGDLACYAINGIDHAIYRAIKNAMSDLNIMASLGAVAFAVLAFVFVTLLMLRIIKHVAEPLVDLSVLAVLSPFIVLLIAIGPMRSTALQALKLMVVALKELIVVSGIVGVMMSLINQAAGWSPTDGETIDIQSSSTWLGGPGYFAALALIVFFFFAFERAVGVPSRLMGMIAARGIQFKIPHPL